MENIDDLMRQKFDSDNPGERFEFQEEYWEQAQALLEQEEDKRRRRWWLFFALILLITLLGWLLLGKMAGEAGWSQNGDSTPSNSLSLQTDTPTRAPIAAQNPASNPSKSIDNQSNIDKHQNSTQHSNSNQPIHKFESGSSKLEQIDNQIIGTESQPVNKVGQAKLPKGNKQVPRESKSANGVVGKGLATENNKGANPPQPKVSPTSPTPQGAASASWVIAENPPTLPNNQSPITNNQSIAPPEIKPIISTLNLPIPPSTLPLPRRVVPLRTIPIVAKELIAESIKPVEKKRFSLGLALAGSANQADTHGLWAGWAIGAYGDYRFNKNWSVMLGAQWRFVPGYGVPADSSNPDRVEQLRYSFGFKQESWKRETRGLHYLEIPLSARWEQRRWGLEAGTATGLLFLVQNKTTLTTQSSLEAAKTTVNKLVKGDATAYNSLYFTGFAGAEYRLTSRISILARGQYRFTPMFKSTNETSPNKGLGNVDLGLRFRLY